MEDFLYQVESGVAHITINRPQVLNAMSADAVVTMTQLLEQAAADHDVLCVLISAAGEKAFCAGGDIKEEVRMDGYSSYDFGLLGQNLMRTMRHLRTPVIIAAHGYALGAGMEMMLAADFTILSDDAKIAMPSINLGSVPGFGGTQLLPQLVGPMRAKEILMSGRHIGAQEAVTLGLALKAVPHAELLSTAQSFAAMLCEKAPFAIRSLKTCVNKAMEVDVESGFLLELQLFSRVQASEDKRQGMEAFIAKRKPDTFINR